MKILAFAGSARRDSWNKKLLAVIATAAGEAGIAVTSIELQDFPMPIYDGDLEAASGVPEKAVELRKLLAEHQAFLIASPEYNGSVSGLLKNSLDWCSRPVNGEEGLAPFRGKLAGLAAASMSPFGGIRGVAHLRGILSKMGTSVQADEMLLPFAQRAFTADGQIADPATEKLAKAFGSGFARAAALSAGQSSR